MKKVALLLIAAFTLLIFQARDLSARQNPGDAKSESPPPPAPSLQITVNGSTEATIRQGSTILIEAAISPPDGINGDAATTLSASNGGWGSLVRVEIKNASGIQTTVPPKPVFSTDDSITIDAETCGELQWTLDKSATASLEPGSYLVSAVLEFRGSGPGWHGKEVSAPAVMTVKSANASLDLAENRRSLIFEMRALHAIGQDSSALAAADAFLREHPSDAQMLEQKGDLLAQSGKMKEAADAYEAAWEHLAPAERKPTTEPAGDLLRKLDMAIDRIKD